MVEVVVTSTPVLITVVPPMVFRKIITMAEAGVVAILNQTTLFARLHQA